MTIKVPVTIKIQVIKEWIRGISRDKIAQENNIGAGTVTGIIQQTKSDTPDMDLIRDLALQLKKENLDLNYFASSVRLKKILDRFELTEEKLDEFLEEMAIYCFKQQINQKEFILKVDKVSNLQTTLKFQYPIFLFLLTNLQSK